MSTSWSYPHQDLGEPLHFDGSPVLRPVVPVLIAETLPAVIGVLDSGSPISVANWDLLGPLGVDPARTAPLYEVPLSIAGGAERTAVYEVELSLRPPSAGNGAPLAWRLQVAARRRWRLPFALLLGQRGWFDTFPTRIDARSSTVEVSRGS